MACIECGTSYNGETINGMQVLPFYFYFTNLHNERINLSKINIRRIYVRYGGREYDILDEARFNYAMNSLSIFVNPYKLFRKRSGVCRVFIEWTYKNNPEVKVFQKQYKYVNDTQLEDFRRRTQKRENGGRKRGGKKQKRH